MVRDGRSGLLPAAWVVSGLFFTLALLAGVIWYVVLRDEEPEPVPEGAELEVVEEEPEVVEPLKRPTGEVAAFERRVERSLAGRTPPTSPLRGGLRVTARRLAWDDPLGGPLLRAEAVVATLQADPFIGDSLVIDRLLFQRAVARVEQDPSGEWNVLAAPPFAQEPGEADGDGFPIVLRRVVVQNSRAYVSMPEQRVRLEDVDAVLPRVVLGGEAPPLVVIGRADARLVVPEEDRAPRRLALRGLRLTFPEDRVTFDLSRLELDRTIVTAAEGAFFPESEGLGLDARLRVERVSFDDIAFLSPRLPREGTAAFQLQVQPAGGALTILRVEGLALRSGESDVTGRLTAVIGPGRVPELRATDLRLDPLQLSLVETLLGRPLPYSGELRGRVEGGLQDLRFDLAAALRGEQFEGVLEAQITGVAAVVGGEFRLRRAAVELDQAPLAALRGLAPGLPLAGFISGRFRLEGMPGEAPLRLDVRFDLAGGVALVEGTVDLTGAVPVYDVTGRLIGVSIARVFEPEVPPVSLTATFAARGRGFDPATADARLSLHGDWLGWRAEPRDTLALRARLAGGMLDLDTLAVELGPLSLAAGGDWALRGPPVENRIRYAIEIDSLAPFGPYLPFLPDAPMRGAFAAAGTLSGSLESPVLDGTAAAGDVRYGQWTIETAEAEYETILAADVPRLRIRAAARDIGTPGAGAYSLAELDLVLARPRFELEFAADRVGGGVVQLAADGRIPGAEGDPGQVILRRAVADLRGQRWALQRLATIRWGGVDGLLVRDLVVEQVDGPGRVAVEGLVPPAAAADLEVRVAALPLGDVLRLVGREQMASGSLWLDARIQGPPGSPEGVGEFELRDGSVRGVPVASLEGDLRYADRLLRGEAHAVLGDTLSGRVDLEARVPIDLDFGAPRFELLRDRPLHARIDTDGFPLAAFEGLSPFVRRLQGTMATRVVVAGTMESPRLDGEGVITDGAMRIIPLDQRYEGINGRVVLDGRVARLVGLEAHSDGVARVEGTLTFEELTDPVADLAVNLDGFRAMGAEDLVGAEATGRVRLTGPVFSAPRISGRIQLDDGNIPVPADQQDPLLEAELAGIAPPDLPEFGPAGAIETEPGWWESLRINNLVVQAGNDLWFVLEDSRAQLAGELTLEKSGEALQVYGTLQGQRGTFTLVAGPMVRRFDIVDAEIRFFGNPEPDPAIDITASRVVFGADNQPTEVRILVQGTISSPRLSLSTPGAGNIPESELLSILFFGRPDYIPGSGLGGSPVSALQQAVVFGGVADLLSLELEEELTEIGLPFDIFQFRPSGVEAAGFFTVPNILVGKELGNDVFLTVEAGVSALFSGDAAQRPFDWTVTLLWLIDREWTAELAYRTGVRRELQRLGLPASELLADQDQFTLDLRRRWTY